jgi:endonuclease/exonuclease/phosphatase family metal-dependent hydrolase
MCATAADPPFRGTAAEEPDLTTVLRVATWNLHSGLDLRTGFVDLGAVAAVVAALDVDLLAVQEVDRELDRSGRTDQVGELARRLGWHGVFVPALLGDPRGSWTDVPATGDPGGPAYGIGLLGRAPLKEARRVVLPARPARPPGPLGRRPEPRVALLATTGEVRVTATHLATVPWRSARQLRCVLGLACGGQDVVLGDLNLPLPLVTAVANGWTAAVAGPTFPACWPWMQLDHVLVRGGGIAGVRLGCGPSDHRALRATVTVR